MTDAYNIFEDQKKSFFQKHSINFFLIAVNIFVFILLYLLLALDYISLDLVALKPSNIIAGKNLWTLFTSFFIHAGFFHLFVNMFSLFFVGGLLENLIGRKRYLWLYLISGLFAGIFFTFTACLFGVHGGILEKVFGNPEILALGASGAIFGVAGVLVMIIPRKKIYLIAGPILAIILEALGDNVVTSAFLTNIISVFVTIYIFVCIFVMFSFNSRLRKIALPIEMPFWFLPIAAIVPLIIIGLFVDLPIGNMAHLGGLIAGLAYGIYLRLKFPNKTQRISKYFS